MDQQAFREFVAMLWGIPVRPEKNIFNVVRSYISWKCRLPPRDRDKAPRIRCMRPSRPQPLIAHSRSLCFRALF